MKDGTFGPLTRQCFEYHMYVPVDDLIEFIARYDLIPEWDERRALLESLRAFVLERAVVKSRGEFE